MPQFEEVVVVDQILISEGNQISYRQATRILRDGEVVSETYYRNPLTQGQDLTDVPEQVAKIAQFVWGV